MLVLTRGIDQEIVIEHQGEKLLLCVDDIYQFREGCVPKVRIGFSGPRSFAIHRSELLDDFKVAAEGRRR